MAGGGGLKGILDTGAGAAQGSKGTTVQTLVISIATGAVVFTIQVIIFQFMRLSKRFAKIYQPRTYLVAPQYQVPEQPRNLFKWLVSIFKIPESEVIEKSGLDAYFFLRFLLMCLKIFIPLAILVLPILLPINATGGKTTNTFNGVKYNVTGLDTLGWSNISPDNASRYWAHLVLALVVIGYTCYCLFAELLHYIEQRQKYLTTPVHRLRASATTVLVTGIPPEFRSLQALDALYDAFPGGIRRIWVNQYLGVLRDKVNYRRKLISHLENAETNLSRNAMAQAKKGENKKSAQNTAKSKALPEDKEADIGDHRKDLTGWDKRDLQYDIATNAVWTKYLSAGDRDTIRILRGGYTFWSSIPIAWIVGIPFTKKVDRIYFCRREIKRVNEKIARLQAEAESAPPVNSAFIQFNQQVAAHMACQSVSHHMPMQMDQRLIEVSPSDVIWYNLSTFWWSQYLRYAAFLLILTAMLLLYTILSAFTGILSRISTLRHTYSWLNWVQTLPRWLLSFIQGTLPPLILQSFLMGLLPMFLRWLIRVLIRQPTRTSVQLSLQLWYFVFLFVILFLVPTISAGLTSVVSLILQNPGRIPNILATNLPTAANYYFSYLILQSLSLSASALTQVAQLIALYVFAPMAINSARDRYQHSQDHRKYHWGSLYPWYTIFAVIGLVYSVIAPLILLFMLVTYSLFWVVSKNNIVYVVRNTRDTGGRFFPRAVTQLFTGLYVLEVSLVGLFFLVRDAQNNVVCSGQATVMIVTIFITLGYQVWLNAKMSPLYTYLPITLEDDATAAEKEFEMERLITHTESEEVARGSSSDTKLDDSQDTKTGDLNDARPKLLDVDQRRSSNQRRSSAFSPDRHGTAEENKQRERMSAMATLAELEKQEAAEAAGDRPPTPPPGAATTAHAQADGAAAEVQLTIRSLMQTQTTALENLAPSQVEELVSLAFEDPALRTNLPIGWIPPDDIGVAEDEMARTKRRTAVDMMTTHGAYFNKDGKAMFATRPPDFQVLNVVLPNL